MSATMDADLSKFIDLVQANEIVHSSWESRLVNECDRLQFEYERADAAAKRLGQKWKERGDEIAHLREQLSHGMPAIDQLTKEREDYKSRWLGSMTTRDAQLIRDENARLRAAATPFIQFYNDIRFNLRKQPRPTDAAIEERGERVACVTWAEFYALRDAFTGEQSVEPHSYVPSPMHMGDCAVCGHLQGAPVHSPFRQK